MEHNVAHQSKSYLDMRPRTQTRRYVVASAPHVVAELVFVR